MDLAGFTRWSSKVSVSVAFLPFDFDLHRTWESDLTSNSMYFCSVHQKKCSSSSRQYVRWSKECDSLIRGYDVGDFMRDYFVHVSLCFSFFCSRRGIRQDRCTTQGFQGGDNRRLVRRDHSNDDGAWRILFTSSITSISQVDLSIAPSQLCRRYRNSRATKVPCGDYGQICKRCHAQIQSSCERPCPKSRRWHGKTWNEDWTP